MPNFDSMREAIAHFRCYGYRMVYAGTLRACMIHKTEPWDVIFLRKEGMKVKSEWAHQGVAA